MRSAILKLLSAILSVFLTLQVEAQCTCTPTGAAVPATLTTSNIPASAYLSITGVVTISGAVTLTGKQIMIAPGGEIDVPAGQALIISGSWLHGCGCMWKGIRVAQGGSLTILNVSIIEDATAAVIAAMGASTNINITQSFFNKNGTGVYLTGLNVTASNPVLDNNIFTCRSGFNYVTTGWHLLGNPGYFALTKNLFNNNYNSLSSTYPTTTTPAGVRSKVGMAAVSFPAGIQTKTTNSVFDYLDYGLYASEADLVSSGNQFSNMPGNGLPVAVEPGYSGIKGTGIGIFVTSRSATHSLDVNAIGASNNFYNLFRGIDIWDYLTVNIDGNTFQNQTTDDFSNFNTAGAWYGQCGVQWLADGAFQTTSGNPKLTVSNNHLLWFANGIHIMRQYYNTAGITVSCNQIGDPGVLPTNTKYVWQGIFLEDVPNGLGQASPTGISITYNNICRPLQNCILATGVKQGLYIRGNGTGLTQYNLSGELSLGYLNGFLHTWDMNTAAIAAINCQNGGIWCNMVKGTGYKNVPGDYPRSTQFGILCDASPSMKLVDNLVTNLSSGIAFTNGIAFRNNCYPATLLNNSVKFCYFSFSLDNTTIGAQGSLSAPRVLELKYDNWETAIDYYLPSSSADPNYNSQLYLYNNMLPTNNYGLVTLTCNYPGGGKQYEFSTLCPSKGINTVASNAAFGFCANTPAHSGDPCGSNPQLSPVDSLRASQLDTALFDSSASNLLAGTRIFQTRRYTWQQMYANNMYSSSSSFAKSFYDQQTNLAIGRFTRIESALASNDIVTAQNENNFSSTNNLELQQQKVNDVRIKMADTSKQLASADTAALFTIANGCPEIDGTAVYDARTLLNLLYGQPLLYASNCVDSNSYRLASTKKSERANGSINLKIFPNPSSGSFKCSLPGVKFQQITVELRDAYGSVVLNDIISLSEQGEFELENVPPGIYVLIVSLSNNTVQQRIVVAK